MVVYITVNKISGSYYIGITNNKKPNYLGSGVAVRDAIKRYGRQSFRRITLIKCNNRETASVMEVYFIEKAKNKWPGRKCYNLTTGGENSYQIAKDALIRRSIKAKDHYNKNKNKLYPLYMKRAENTIVKFSKENGPVNKKLSNSQCGNVIFLYRECHFKIKHLAILFSVSVSVISNVVKSVSRGYNGEGNGRVKLTYKDVCKIRDTFRVGIDKYTDFAKTYNVKYQTIKRIVMWETWKY